VSLMVKLLITTVSGSGEFITESELRIQFIVAPVG